MSSEDSAKLSQAVHQANHASTTHTEYKNAPVPDLSGQTSGGQDRGN